MRQETQIKVAMNIAVIDVGKPDKILGWIMAGPQASEGTNIDSCVDTLALALDAGPLALGFEAPMFVPMREHPAKLLSARSGECNKGVSRPFSAAAGASVLVTGLVVVSYVLAKLRRKVHEGKATLNWNPPPSDPGRLLLFEAFVTDQPKTRDPRHIDDARLAVAAFQRGMVNPATFRSSVVEPRPALTFSVQSCCGLDGHPI